MELSNSSGKNSKRQSYLGREKKYFHERIRWIELELVISFRFEYLIPSLWDGLLHYSQALSGNASVSQIMSNARIASGFVQKNFFISQNYFQRKLNVFELYRMNIYQSPPLKANNIRRSVSFISNIAFKKKRKKEK